MTNEIFPSYTREQLAKRPRRVAAWMVLVLMALAAGDLACTPDEEETAEGIEEATAEGRLWNFGFRCARDSDRRP